MTREHVFVYGTLRRGAGHPMHAALARMSQFVGMARFKGQLYDLGPYPGAVPDPRAEPGVLGELYAFLPGQPLLTQLDRYEGCTSLDPKPHEFIRHRVPLTREDGSLEPAWIYLYAGTLTRERHISSGDYLQRATSDRSPEMMPAPTDDSPQTADASLRPSAARTGRVRQGVLALAWCVVLLAGMGATPRGAAAQTCTDVEPCIAQLQLGETRRAREFAAKILGERNDPKALPALIKALQSDPGEFVRANAAASLGRLAESASVDALQAVLKDDPSELVRAAAAEALGLFKDPRVLAPLGAALASDADHGVRETAARALGRIGDAQALSALTTALAGDARVEVRVASARALGALKAEGGIDRLKQVLREDADERVRSAVAITLGKVHGDAVTQILVAALQADDQREVRLQIVRALGEQRKQTPVAALVETLKSDPALEVRREAIFALGKIGGAQALDALHYFAEKSVHQDIRKAAKQTLADLPQGGAAPSPAGAS